MRTVSSVCRSLLTRAVASCSGVKDIPTEPLQQHVLTSPVCSRWETASSTKPERPWREPSRWSMTPRSGARAWCTETRTGGRPPAEQHSVQKAQHIMGSIRQGLCAGDPYSIFLSYNVMATVTFQSDVQAAPPPMHMQTLYWSSRSPVVQKKKAPHH